VSAPVRGLRLEITVADTGIGIPAGLTGQRLEFTIRGVIGGPA
jgi:hypothetical protein